MELLDQAFPKVETGTLSAPEARAQLALATAATAVDPEPVAFVEDRTIPGPAGEIPVRVYRPHSDEPLPIVVYFHGGGFVLCGLDTHDATCRALTNAVGCAVVSVDYRLAPEHRFPAAAEDAYAATAWVAAHAADVGGDATRVAVAGDSAGGNLAAVVPLLARQRNGPALAFQLMIYPVTDSAMDTPSHKDNAEGYFLTRGAMKWFWDQYLGPDGDGTDPLASPFKAADLSGLPAAMVITAEFDPLRDEGEAYGRRLEEAGVPTTVKRYDGVFHGFFGLGAFVEASKHANEDAYAALRSAFAP